MNEWMNEWVSEWVSEWLSEWVKQRRTSVIYINVMNGNVFKLSILKRNGSHTLG